MIAESLSRVLEATGYLHQGEPATPSVSICEVDQFQLHPSFAPEASWRSRNPSSDPNNVTSSREITVYFKYLCEPVDSMVVPWHREVWNRGFTPLLWVVSEQRVDLYNGFSRPRRQESASDHLMKTFRTTDTDLKDLDLCAGRLSMETGQFWQNNPSVNRKTAVDRQLLQDLRELEKALVSSDLELNEAHELIIRSIFAKYLFDRKILLSATLDDVCGRSNLAEVFNDRIAAQRLFGWMQDTFGGDMFPPSSARLSDSSQLETIGDFFRGKNLITCQQSLFPYQFDVIPVELISAVYEHLVHSSIRKTHSSFKRSDSHYSPLSVVSIILDEVMNELSGNETVLDLTCGSGVFLVEALRRLVHLKTRDQPLSRNMILETLYNQVYGIGESEAAIRVSAFCMYLTALDLDPSCQTKGCTKFRPIIGKTLLVGDALGVHQSSQWEVLLAADGSLKRFDVIIGNPDWGNVPLNQTDHPASVDATNINQPHTPPETRIDFLQRAMQFSHEQTRLGMVVSAMKIFATSHIAQIAVRESLRKLLPVTLVNLSELSSWLFPNTDMPAMVILGRHNWSTGDDLTLVQAHWSLRNRNSGMIEFAPSDVSALSFAAWENKPVLLKAGFLGQERDLSLLLDLSEHFGPLEEQSDFFGTRFRTGLFVGDEGQSESHRLGRETLNPGFFFSESMPNCVVTHAGEPRTQNTAQGPLLLVRRFLIDCPRPMVTIHEDRIAFDDAYFGVSFTRVDSKSVCEIMAGILRSQLTSWYLLMTGSIFGLTAHEITRRDIAALPVPDLEAASHAEPGRKIRRFVNHYRRKEPRGSEWEDLDGAVFDLYTLDVAERIILQDGCSRARWHWNEGRSNSMQPVEIGDLTRYAETFLGTMDAWMRWSARPQMRAEIYRFPGHTPIQVIRFFIDRHARHRGSRVVVQQSSLSAVLEGISSRTEVRVASEFVGLQELRVHSSNEVDIVKSAARRNWLGVQALSDADQVVRDVVSSQLLARQMTPLGQ